MNTPGPWFAHGKLRRVILTQLDPRHSRQIAELSDMPHDGLTDAELEANARLIAAAPELLAALRLATHCLAFHAKEHGAGMDEKALADACAAIAKATGA